VQVIDGATGAIRWHPFPFSAFSFSREKSEIRVADNTFSLDGIDALLRDDEGDFPAHFRYGGVLPRHREARLHGRRMTAKIRSRRLSLSLRVERSDEGVLLAPVQGAMDRRIGESNDARARVRLAGPRGDVIFEGTSAAAGLEAVGDMRLLGVEVAAGSARAGGVA
jgi:hypothetical protein